MQFVGIELLNWIEAAVVILVTYSVARLISRFLERFFKRTTLPEEGTRKVTRFLKYAIYIVGAIVTISVLGFDPTDVILGLGVFSIAVSFALSTAIHNLVSGIIVQADKAFKIGDEIRVSVFEGAIVKISMRTTTLKTKEGDAVLVPNSFFITNPVVKRARPSGT